MFQVITQFFRYFPVNTNSDSRPTSDLGVDKNTKFTLYNMN